MELVLIDQQSLGESGHRRTSKAPTCSWPAAWRLPRAGDTGAYYDLGVAFSTGSHGVAVRPDRSAQVVQPRRGPRATRKPSWCRADISEEMTAREIAEAQRRARQWLRRSKPPSRLTLAVPRTGVRSAEEALVGRDAHALALEKIGHRRPKARIGDPVRRPGLHRLVAAGQLVPALRARLHPRQPARDRRVDRLVIAQLEMQERLVDQAAPVAAVERSPPMKLSAPAIGSPSS